MPLHEDINEVIGLLDDFRHDWNLKEQIEFINDMKIILRGMEPLACQCADILRAKFHDDELVDAIAILTGLQDKSPK